MAIKYRVRSELFQQPGAAELCFWLAFLFFAIVCSRRPGKLLLTSDVKKYFEILFYGYVNYVTDTSHNQ